MEQVGAATYPDATRLLITADCGGANGSRRRAWKTELAALAAETGLDISVCHLPPGTSKWNKIEHRLFAQITRTWGGTPLTSHQTILELIGCHDHHHRAEGHRPSRCRPYPTGVKITDRRWRSCPSLATSSTATGTTTLHPTRDTPEPH